MNKPWLLHMLLPLLVIWGYGCDGGPAGVQPTPDDRVIANAHAVQKAFEDFAAENNGGYPRRVGDKSVAGNTFVDLLPGGVL
ncbi:MAG: hypothetical protein V3V49_05910, partial [Candidatus Krumholzibacteria bacterium]